jgi:primase-polymerase (primpol)-like protein
MDEPKFLEIIKDNIPSVLKEFKSWVVWRQELTKDGKPTKVPYNAKSGMRASSNNKSTWADFYTAYYKYEKSNGKYDGIGFVVSDNDPFIGIDLDNCRDVETGEIKQWAVDIVKRLCSYTEISPSGTGIRIFIVADLPADGRKKGDVEIYKKGRYLTITGHKYNGV